jgi:hypothetical protein
MFTVQYEVEGGASGVVGEYTTLDVAILAAESYQYDYPDYYVYITDADGEVVWGMK